MWNFIESFMEDLHDFCVSVLLPFMTVAAFAMVVAIVVAALLL